MNVNKRFIITNYDEILVIRNKNPNIKNYTEKKGANPVNIKENRFIFLKHKIISQFLLAVKTNFMQYSIKQTRFIMEKKNTEFFFLLVGSFAKHLCLDYQCVQK